MKKIETSLELITKKITVKEYFTGVIRKGNNHSARINIPVGYEGKKFILAIMEEDNNAEHNQHQ
jgi:putative transposon-encoded protein